MPPLRLLCTLIVLSLLGTAAAPVPPDASAPITYKAVLVAGDGSLPVFDNAVRDVERRLRKAGAASAADIQRFSADEDRLERDIGLHPATLDRVLDAVAALRPAPGQGCFLFATSHGAEHRGLWLDMEQEHLTPRDLDDALTAGCGEAPTVVVMSGCYTGSFAQPPMARANRIILTAARPDRTSFGCGAGRTYTAFDQCLLAALDAGGTWPRAYALIQACVTAEERTDNAYPSEPQAWFGPAVAGLPVPAGALPTGG